MSDATGSYGRGLWPSRYTAFERTSLSVQSKHDRRTVPLKWYWRYLTDEDPSGAAPDETYYENPDIHREYQGPVGVHLYVDDTPKQKGMKKGAVVTEGEIRLSISRAECIRLGGLFGTRDDREATLEFEANAGDAGGPFALQDPLFIPRAGDVFMFRRKHHRINVMEPDYEASLSPQGTVMVWKGTAALLQMDATFPTTLRKKFIPPTSDPVVPHEGRDVSWPG